MCVNTGRNAAPCGLGLCCPHISPSPGETIRQQRAIKSLDADQVFIAADGLDCSFASDPPGFEFEMPHTQMRPFSPLPADFVLNRRNVSLEGACK
jgi:hypothetical protein